MLFFFTALRPVIRAIGKASVAKNCVIPGAVRKKHPLEIEAMEQHEMATVSVTVMSKPVTATPLDVSEFTTYESRKHLQENGWSFVETAFDCSVKHKRMMKFQCKEYYILLIIHPQAVQHLTEWKSFSHAQKRGYYAAVTVLCGSFATPLDEETCLSHISSNLG